LRFPRPRSPRGLFLRIAAGVGDRENDSSGETPPAPVRIAVTVTIIVVVIVHMSPAALNTVRTRSVQEQRRVSDIEVSDK